jgi:hypothetical protein
MLPSSSSASPSSEIIRPMLLGLHRARAPPDSPEPARRRRSWPRPGPPSPSRSRRRRRPWCARDRTARRPTPGSAGGSPGSGGRTGAGWRGRRAGVRLDRHPVLRPQRLHVEGGHQGGHRGAGRLVPADLQPVTAFAQVVGVVDGPRRQPENAFLETAQQRDFLPLGRQRAVSHASSPAFMPARFAPHRSFPGLHTLRSGGPSTPATS